VRDSRWAEIDLGAIRHNVSRLQRRLPLGAAVIAVIKANGYGHGACEVARAALEGGAALLAVSTPLEACELAGICEPERVLALGGLVPDQAPDAVAAGCAVICHSEEMIDALEAAAVPGRPVAVHLKVDTGMSRLGCAPAEAPALAHRIAHSPRLRLAGIMTHFASSESDEPFTRGQYTCFQDVLAALDVDPGMRTACNSAAALRHPEMALDGVRCGIAIYGYESPDLRPALRLKALVTQVKEIKPGTTVGYGRTWTAARPTLIATVAIGYEDGVFRSRSNRGEVVVRGRRVPLIGRVSMDQITLDVSSVPDVRPGDVATLIGDGISAEEVGEWSGTLCYEVLTSLGTRVRRIYTDVRD
jgi:alanine racemase